MKTRNNEIKARVVFFPAIFNTRWGLWPNPKNVFICTVTTFYKSGFLSSSFVLSAFRDSCKAGSDHAIRTGWRAKVRVWLIRGFRTGQKRFGGRDFQGRRYVHCVWYQRFYERFIIDVRSSLTWSTIQYFKTTLTTLLTTLQRTLWCKWYFGHCGTYCMHSLAAYHGSSINYEVIAERTTSNRSRSCQSAWMDELVKSTPQI